MGMYHYNNVVGGGRQIKNVKWAIYRDACSFTFHMCTGSAAEVEVGASAPTETSFGVMTLVAVCIFAVVVGRITAMYTCKVSKRVEGEHYTSSVPLVQNPPCLNPFISRDTSVVSLLSKTTKCFTNI